MTGGIIWESGSELPAFSYYLDDFVFLFSAMELRLTAVTGMRELLWISSKMSLSTTDMTGKLLPMNISSREKNLCSTVLLQGVSYLKHCLCFCLLGPC